MRVKNVRPANNFILYVEFEDKVNLKYDMTRLIDEDASFFELKYFPEKFISARPYDEGRVIAWGNDAFLPSTVVEQNGIQVDVGFLILGSANELELLSNYSSDPHIGRILGTRLGSTLFLEKEDYIFLNEWLVSMMASNMGSNYEFTDLAMVYETMLLEMSWPDFNQRSYLDY